jgi:hypothetical protein
MTSVNVTISSVGIDPVQFSYEQAAESYEQAAESYELAGESYELAAEIYKLAAESYDLAAESYKMAVESCGLAAEKLRALLNGLPIDTPEPAKSTIQNTPPQQYFYTTSHSASKMHEDSEGNRNESPAQRMTST